MGGAAPGEGAAQLVLLTILLLSLAAFTTVHSRDLSDREILRALSILLREGRASSSGQEDRQVDRHARQEGRRGRQQLATSQARTQQLEAELAQAREQQAGLQV